MGPGLFCPKVAKDRKIEKWDKKDQVPFGQGERTDNMNKKTEAIILGIMCFILTIAICIQINTVNNNGSTVSGSQKQNDLKSQVLKMKEKYETEYASLQRAEKELEKERESATSNNSELADLENQIKKANLILGNTDVTGEGIIVTLTDGKGDPSAIDQSNYLVHAENILQVVNEMKNAGAEAIAINGERIVSTSAISCDGNVIVVNGKKINSPIQISAIGLQELLSTLNRPGSTLEYFKNNSGKIVDFKKNSNIEIPKFTGVISFKYAKTVN
mgnify:CR=1 FL=1